MIIDTFKPNEGLRPFIKSYLILESQDERVNSVLPDTSIVMAFRFKGQVGYLTDDKRTNLPLSVVSGLRKSGRFINYSRNAGNILVIFKEAGAHAFIKEPLYELFEDSLSLEDLAFYRDISILEERLAGAMDNSQRIHLIERFLLSKLYNYKSDPLILAALERIKLARGNFKIKDLASTLCISLDAFEKRFRRIVGISPKQFSYIIRMKSVLSSGLGKQTLTEIALNAGYFDQAHFNKDFKLFTGKTPTDYIKSPVLW